MEERDGKNPTSYPSEETRRKHFGLDIWLGNKRTTEQNLGEMIEEFHRKFDIPIGTTAPTDRHRINAFRTEFMLLEEVQELLKAVNQGDAEGVLDAIADIIYVAAGTGVEVFGGRTLDIALQRVHKSNMTKQAPSVHGEKITKGADFVPVDLSDLV